MVSKQIIPIIGLNVTVYGLEEYQRLPKNTPVAVIFALHGRLQDQTKMQDISELLCSLNNSRKNSERHLLVITFDSSNHGSRLQHKIANHAWVEGKHRNPNHALDMWSAVDSTSNTVSELIDVLDHYLFGPQAEHVTQVYGVIGFSMGGHSSFLAAANDHRISVSIPIVGTADFLALMLARAKDSDVSVDTHVPQFFQKLVRKKTEGLDEKLKETHILILNGGKDELVHARYNTSLVNNLRKTHVGKENHDWKYYVIPGVGHEWSPVMGEMSKEWVYQWMIKTTNDSKL